MSGDIMPMVNGKSFHCTCGCNVFHHPDEAPDRYECNACGAWYIGQPVSDAQVGESWTACPFCGCQPEPFGRTLVNGSFVAQLKHPITGNCALDMLVFSVDKWEQRYGK